MAKKRKKTSKRKSATDISDKVRKIVEERDSFDGWVCCVICGEPKSSSQNGSLECMHYVSRNKGGCGIEENLAFGCIKCHREIDQTQEGVGKRKQFLDYLQSHYPYWSEELVKFKR